MDPTYWTVLKSRAASADRGLFFLFLWRGVGGMVVVGGIEDVDEGRMVSSRSQPISRSVSRLAFTARSSM